MALHDTEIYGVQFKLETLGVKEAAKYMNDVVAAMRKMGMGKKDISDWVKSTFDGLKNLGMASDELKKVLDKVQVGSKGQKTQINDAANFLTQIGAVYAAWRMTLSPFKKVYAFAEGISKVNFELLRMSVNANLAMSTLNSLGGALQAYGGSAKDIAASAQKYNASITGMKLGRGLGMFERLIPWGVDFNPEDTYELYLDKIARKMQEIAPADRRQFATDAGISDAEFLSMQEGYAAWKAERDRISMEYGQGAVLAAERAKDFNKSTAELALAWKDIKDILFSSIEPVLGGILKSSAKLLNSIKDNEYALTAIVSIVTVLGGAIALLSFSKLIGQAGKLFGLLSGSRNILGGAGGFAGGAAGAGGMGGGGGAAAGITFLGESVKDAAMFVGMAVILERMQERLISIEFAVKAILGNIEEEGKNKLAEKLNELGTLDEYSDPIYDEILEIKSILTEALQIDLVAIKDAVATTEKTTSSVTEFSETLSFHQTVAEAILDIKSNVREIKDKYGNESPNVKVEIGSIGSGESFRDIEQSMESLGRGIGNGISGAQTYVMTNASGGI